MNINLIKSVCLSQKYSYMNTLVGTFKLSVYVGILHYLYIFYKVEGIVGWYCTSELLPINSKLS